MNGEKIPKKWLYVLVSIATALSIVAAFDLDKDGARGWDEWLKYKTGLWGPIIHNLSFKYAAECGIKDPTLLHQILVLEEDSRLDMDEKALIEAIGNIESSLIPAEIIDKYYSEDEITAIQENLLKSVLDDNKISVIEIEVIKRLEKWDRWYIVRDIYNSGMVNSEVLPENWDCDFIDGKPLSNFDEIMNEINPLNGLEVHPNNLSERWVIITSALGFTNSDFEIRRVSRILEILQKNGYSDETVFLVLDPGFSQIEMVKELAIKPDFTVKYLTGEGLPPPSDENEGNRVPGWRDAEAEHFLSYIINLPSDENDLVFINENAHGSRIAIHIGRNIFFSELHDALRQMKQGEAIAIFNSCGSNIYIKNLDDLYKNPNILLIGYDDEIKGNISDELLELFKYLDSGLNLTEALDRAVTEERNRVGDFLFTISGREKPFQNFLVYKKFQEN